MEYTHIYTYNHTYTDISTKRERVDFWDLMTQEGYPSPLSSISNFHPATITEQRKGKLWDVFAVVTLVTAPGLCKIEQTGSATARIWF